MERTLEGNRKAQESTDRRGFARKGSGSRRERTPGGSKAPKRACRSFTGEPRRGREVAVEVACASGSYAADLAIARNLRHDSCVTGRLHGWARGKESSRMVKAVVEPPITTHRQRSESEPAREKRPGKPGTAPRKGKALEGSSRDASGMKQGREASGVSGSGGPRKGFERAGTTGRNRREGQEP
jgi:hypothetical protein